VLKFKKKAWEKFPEVVTMLIQVLWKDNRRVYVQDHNLDDLIKTGQIQEFFRPYSNEWVNVKGGPIREKTSIEYDGPERRFKAIFTHANFRRY
jgi:hypothetical protein